MKMDRNPGMKLDLGWINECDINLPSVIRRAETLGTRRTVKKQWQAAWLLRAVTCIDLTTLSGDDTSTNVERLCHKASHPIREDILKKLNFEDEHLIKCGAVCVYPAQVKCAVQTLKRIGSNVPVAAVATGFPSGQYSLKTRLEEIRLAVADGASEIDIVINREMALTANWQGLYDELVSMRSACGEAHMKAILAVGELGSLTTVRRASLVAMMAGADFIKTSTGKEGVNAILPVGLVMCRAIRDFYDRSGGVKVGFKPAGGIRSSKDSLLWLILIKEELGNEWLNNHMFRIGASGLLSDIERQLFHYVYGRYAAASELSMC